MRFTELICRVAAARFEDRAQLGVRLSPVVLDTDEAGELVRVARDLLPAGTYIAVAAPGAPDHDDERTCTSAGERAAERATAWRNQLAPGERILYVSVRRLGRAGGLEDTLYELTDSELRDGVLAWCAGEGRLPEGLVAALRDAGVVERADARSLCRFAAAAASAAVEEIGRLLPLLDLAADSRLAEDPRARINANARWVRTVATADNRGTGKLGTRAIEVRKQLGAAIGTGDDVGGLGAVDLGQLTTEELNSDTPKGTRQPRPPASAAPKPTTASTPSAAAKPTGKGPAKPEPTRSQPSGRTQAGPMNGPAAAGPTRVDGAVPVPATIGGSDPAGPAPLLRDSDPPALTPRAGGSLVPDSDEVAGGGPQAADADEPPNLEDGADGITGEEGPALGADGVNGNAGAGGESRPEVRPARSRARRLAGPWTEAMHAEERAGAPLLPDGVRRLIAAVLEGSGDGLVWTIASDPGSLLRAPPKTLREPVRQASDLLDQGAVDAWRVARRAVLDLLGDGGLDLLNRIPYTALGDERIAPLVEELLTAWRRLIADAASAGAPAIAAALSLDSASVITPTGHAVVVLSPLHPLVLAELAERLPAMARAAQLRGPARTLLAAAVDAPNLVPVKLPTRWGELSWQSSPRATPIFGAVRFPDPAMSAVVTQTALALVRLHPQAGLCLTVAAEEAPLAVASGVADALQQDPTIRRAVIYAGDAVALAEGHEPLLQSGRLRVEPLAGTMRPHLWVRAARDTGVGAAAPSWLPALGIEWRLAERSPIDLAAIEAGRDPVGWTLCVGPALRGAPRRPQLVLSRGSVGSSCYAILCADPRGAARALTRTYKAIGVEKLTPRTIENLTRDLATGAAGLVSLDEAGDGRVASLLVELAIGQALGEDALVAGLEGDDVRILLGVRGGSFCIGATWTPGGVRVAFGAGAVSRALGPVDAEALQRGLEVVRLAGREGEVGSAARTAIIRALASGWRRHDDGPAILDAIAGGAKLLPESLGVGPAGSVLRTEEREIPVRVVTPAMLEELVVGMRG